MADSATEHLDLNNRRATYVVMHHIESKSTPNPLSSPPDSGNGINATRTVYIYNTMQGANSHAYKLWLDRWRIRNGGKKDKSESLVEFRDFNDALLGTGYWFMIEMKNETEIEVDDVYKEWFWIETQFMDLKL